MATGVRIEVKSNRFAQIAARLPGVADKIVQETAAAIAEGAKAGAPFATGALRNSIAARSTGPASAAVEVGVPYGTYVEHGTYKMAAQPYLMPAVERQRQTFLGRLAKIESEL